MSPFCRKKSVMQQKSEMPPNGNYGLTLNQINHYNLNEVLFLNLNRIRRYE